MISRFKNILLIQLGDIGDVVLTTPTIRAVKESCPDALVSILVRKPYGNLLLADPNIYEVVESEKIRGALPHILQEYITFARRLRQAHYDLVVDLRTGDRGAILAYLTSASVRIGRKDGKKQFWQKIFFTKTLSDIPYAPLPTHPGADQSLRIVRALGMNTKDSTPKLHILPKEVEHTHVLLRECGLTSTDRWITINPCSRWKYKEWGYEKWGELTDLLWRKHRLTTLLVGAPEDMAATEIIAKGRSGYAFNLAGKTTLGELAALLSVATAHLGVDSAASHIAAAVGTPTITIFGPGNWKGWTVVDEFHRIVTKAMPCVPCNRMGCYDTGKSRCLDELGVDEVWRPTEALWASIERLKTDSRLP